MNLTGPSGLTVGAGGLLGASVTVGSNQSLIVDNTTTVASGGALSVSGGTLNTPALLLNESASLNVYGDIPTKIAGMTYSNIVATGTLSIGDANSYGGFYHQGSLAVGNHDVTLNTNGVSKLGSLTTTDNGILEAANGVYLRGGSVLAGSGTVEAKLAVGFGSTIEATGDLDLGSASSFVGFFSDGELIVDTHTVTIHDQNNAVLGSLTDLGSESDGGTRVATNGLLIEQGKVLVGRGLVTGDLVNQGNVYGDSAVEGQLVFDVGHTVSGIGSFTNVLFNGTYSPGQSYGITHLTDTAFGSDATVEIELGALFVFEGASVSLDGQLIVDAIYGFMPSRGDAFQIFDFSGLTSGNTGQFNMLTLPSLSNALSWDSSHLYTSGTLSVVPEPTTLSLLAVGTLMVCRRRRRHQ